MTELQKALVLENMRLVHFFARRIFGTKNQLHRRGLFTYEDAVQWGSLALVKAARCFDPARGIKFSTYASRCIVRELNMLRQRGRLDPLALDMERLGTTLAVSQQFGLDPDENEALLRAVELLPTRLREVVLLRYWEGCSLREIGTRWGVSASRAGQICERALQHLRSLLTPAA